MPEIGPNNGALFTGLPGEELMRKGMADLLQGRQSIPSLLVASGLPRLQWNGLDLGDVQSPSQPELKLYALLCDAHPEDAYARYNVLMRQLVSFSRALESRLRRVA